jgi:hypothetical protein
MKDFNSDLVATAAQYEKLATAAAQRSVEIVDTVVVEIVDEETLQLDCAMLWAEVFSPMATITEDDMAAKIPELERCIRAQYQDLFQGPMYLLPARKDSGFRIRIIPGIEPPNKSLY